MLFLLLALLSSSVLALVLKYLNTSSPYGVYLVNYITCTLLAFGAMEPRTLFRGDFTPCWLGAVTGLIYLASLAANGASIHKNGAILSSVFTRLGVLVPILVSVALFGERPTLVQGLGIALAVAAAVGMNGLPGRESRPAAGAAVSQIIVLIYNMADTFYIGRTGDPYMLAGASLILPVFNMLLCLSSLAGVGGGTLISRLLGAREEAEARKVSVFSFYLGLVLAVAYGAGLGLMMEPALRFLGAGDTIIVYARQYAFCVIVLGAVPTVLSNVLSNLVRSVGLSKEAGFGISLVLAIARWAVFNIPMIFLLNHLVGMYGIIWSPIVGDTLTVLVSIYAYRTQKPQLESRT